MIANIKIIAAIAAFFIITGSGLYVWHRIDRGGFERCEAQYQKAAIEENQKVVETKKEVKHETQSLDRIGIVKQLCAAGWVRGRAGCPAK